MADILQAMTLRPIGFVRNEIKDTPRDRRDWEVGTVSEIVIDASLTEALDGLEQFSHIIVLFWMHKLTESDVPLKIHPMHREDLPLVGLFATRAPNRPNRIGETVVRLIERQGNVLKVEGLDALDGSPVIDIKPYIPDYYSSKDMRVPSWLPKQ